MNRPTLVLRGLRFYWRTHLGVSAGVALSAAVLVGALGVGDSTRRSLERIAQARLGRVDVTLDAGNRHFQDALAFRLGIALNVETAAALHVRGMALAGAKQVNRVEVFGIDEHFLGLAESPPAIKLGPHDQIGRAHV